MSDVAADAAKSDAIRILLIEDNLDDAQLFRASVAHAGEGSMAIDQAQTLSAAFEALGRTPYTVVVQDLNLPDSHGLLGFEELRRLYPKVPVVVLTSTADKEIALQAVRAGAQDFLVKGSINSEVLVRALRYAIERKALQERIEYEASHDMLTGLLNRQKVMCDLDIARQRALRYGEKLSVCLCDVDGFKRINDTYGHLAGDAILKTCGETIQAELRTTDFVGRYGGDEFLAVFVHTPATGATIAVERIRAQIEKATTTAPSGSAVKFTVTFGLADLDRRDMPLNELIASADEALYRGKTSGKNCIIHSSRLPMDHA